MLSTSPNRKPSIFQRIPQSLSPDAARPSTQSQTTESRSARWHDTAHHETQELTREAVLPTAKSHHNSSLQSFAFQEQHVQLLLTTIMEHGATLRGMKSLGGWPTGPGMSATKRQRHQRCSSSKTEQAVNQSRLWLHTTVWTRLIVAIHGHPHIGSF